MTTASLPSAVRADRLSVMLGARRIIESVSVDARHGELVGVVGPNGAGKSTLLRAMSAVLPASSGVVLIEGRRVDERSRRDLARLVALVPQQTLVDFAFTVQDVVLMGRHPHVRRFSLESDADLSIAMRAMELTGTAHLAERSITSLSGGERQLVFIAKGLAQEPRILLLDEPVAALDIRHQLDILTVVRQQVDAGLTCVVVLHDLNLAARYCDRLALMAQGQIVAIGSPERVLTEPALCAAYRVQTRVRFDEETGSMSVVALRPADVS